MTAKQRIEEFLKKNNIRTNRFYGKCIHTDNGFLVIGDILSKEEGNLLLREDGDRLQLFTGKENTFFEANKFYEFSIYIPVEQAKKEIVVVIDLKFLPPVELSLNPYKEIVRLRYERLDNPEANKMIANLMREIGKGLYSSKQRMIFELLQNADDTPAGNDVSFHIDAYYDYLLIMHNGLPFNQDDVEAITSAAESTKRNDRKKTGYKGIGFKSVFTDSEEVLIKSGGFLFLFKRNHTAYNNFDSFYFSKKRYTDYPILLEEDKLKYTKQRKSFNGHTDIPWQLIPVWAEELPRSLENSRLATYNNNVGFAIKFGREKVEEYLEAVANFADSPHFMLFLRHVNTFKSFKNAITIRKSGLNPVLIERIAQDGNNLKLTYFKKEIDDIKVNDEALAEEGVIIYKRQRENEYGEISHYFSADIEGEKAIESIPPKLAAFDETSITFAAPVIDKIIRAEPDYLFGKSISSFYTFLPMKEMRISLPFLVNADFVPSADRESLQGDNEWNEYIISKISYNHLRWLKEIAEESIITNKKQPEYLSLLLKEMLPDDFTIRMLIEKYNSVYRKSLDEVDFIINDKNKLCKTSEIVIDTTGISNLLGSNFFYSISTKEKHLPNRNINSSYLLYEYLEIEKFNSDELIEILDTEENKELLYTAIKNLEKENYLNFLKWLDRFCKDNDTESDWITSLPFIRIDNEVLSLDEVLEVEDFILKTSKTKSIESLLKKIGFKISEFYVDEEDYKHVYAAIYQQESYLKNDVKLFEHIAAAKELNKLTAQEKNSILVFFDSLEKVGEAKYAKSLALFNSKKTKGNLKPLATLISNSCQNLPDWLTDFVIDEQEENSLNESFKNSLIKQKDLLEKVFCYPTTFNELINNIDQSNIETFYTYILKLHKELPEDAEELDYSQISWFYMPDSDLFALPSTIYCPDSLTKLTITKYNNVKTVIESLSTDKLPIYASISLKKSFGLGCRNVNLVTLLTGTESFEIIVINDFLDWVQSEGEKEFFTQFFIIKEGELYKIVPSKGVLQYYTNNQDLITLIESSELKSKVVLLPNEVHSNERNKIGLLEGIELLKYLIEKGMAKPTLSSFILKENNSDLSQLYIKELDSLEIDSLKKYDKNTDEYKVLEIITQTTEIIDDEDKIKTFRKNIYIDSNALKERAISDDIRFYENKSLKVQLNIKLSEVLDNYADKTYSISEIVEKFTNFKNKGLAKIFKAQGLSPKKIYNQLNELNPNYFNPVQTFFLSYFKYTHSEEDVFNDKVLFSKYHELNTGEFNKEIREFLDICLLEKYVKFTEHDIISDFTPLTYILDDDYAIESEKPPLWFTEWIGDEIDEDKKAFLESLGVNTTESSVVLLRKAILDNETDLDALRGNLDNEMLFKNTILWIKQKSDANLLVLTSDLLKPLYSRVFSLKIEIEELAIPVMIDLSENHFKLIEHKEKNNYHLYHSGWKNEKDLIFELLRKKGIFILNTILPEGYRNDLETKQYNVEEYIDSETVNEKSVDFEESYYQTWELKNTFSIKIFKGSRLPYKLTYDEELLKIIELNTSDFIDGVLFVSEDIKDAIPMSIKSQMEVEEYNSLYTHKHEFSKKEKNNIEYNSKELDALKRIFDENLPDDYQKNYNLAACVSALVELEDMEYNVDKAVDNLKKSHNYAQIEPVYKIESPERAFTVMCRSAIYGLLYLTLKAWNRIDQENIMLFTYFGNSGGELHYNKQSILDTNEKSTDYQILRIESEANAELIDSLFNKQLSKIDEEKITLILRVKENKNYDALFYKDYLPDTNYDNNNNVRTDFTNSGGY